MAEPSSGYSTYEESTADLYPASSFAYMFYFLSCVLINSGEAIGKDDSLVGKALKVISAHAKIRDDGDGVSMSVINTEEPFLGQTCPDQGKHPEFN